MTKDANDDHPRWSRPVQSGETMPLAEIKPSFTFRLDQCNVLGSIRRSWIRAERSSQPPFRGLCTKDGHVARASKLTLTR